MTGKRTDPKNAKFRIASSNVSTQYLAEILGVTPDAVTKLHSAGVIWQNGVARGKYDLVENVNAYLDHLRSNKGSDVDARLKLAQVDKIRNQIDKMKNELVKTTDALEVFRVAFTLLRDIAAAVPKRVAARLAKSNSPDEVRTILREEFDGIGERFIKGLNLNIDGAKQHGTENRDLSISRGVASH